MSPTSTSSVRHEREVAWRLFSQEISASAFQEKGSGEKAPTHLLTPLGARANRLFLVGSLTQIERRGTDEAPLWRARFTDPTGGVTVTAGAYQPRAMSFLAQSHGPCRVAMIGKAHLFTGRDGADLVSVRAEEVAPTDEGEERRWIVETARMTLERVRLLERLRETESLEGPTRPIEGEFPRRWVESARSTRGRYPTVDLAAYRRGARKALESVRGAPEGSG